MAFYIVNREWTRMNTNNFAFIGVHSRLKKALHLLLTHYLAVTPPPQSIRFCSWLVLDSDFSV